MDRRADKQTRQAAPARSGVGRQGFTLVELLTIIAILGLLIGMLAPSIQEVRKGFKADQSRVYINLLVTGIENYRTDYNDELPPSDGSYPHVGGNSNKTNPSTGAAGLAQCLLGYKKSNDDGVDGVGFRRIRAGKVYGPYVPQKIPTTKIENEDPRFVDAFGNEILYYRWDNNTYNQSDNRDGPSSIMGYVRNPGPDKSDRPYYRKDYILITPGADRVWAEVDSKTTKVDDIANFSFYVKERFDD